MGAPITIALMVVLAGCGQPTSAVRTPEAPTPLPAVTQADEVDDAAEAVVAAEPEVDAVAVDAVTEDVRAPAPVVPEPPADSQAVQVAQRKDGDSFVATDGVEYRVGLVDTPELSDCGGSEASTRTYELLADGFVPHAYATDNYGRTVARIATSAGDLGVLLASEGMANDRYFDQFRHENPSYADELAVAFVAAREGGAGFWSSCWAADDRPAASAADNLPAAPVPTPEAIQPLVTTGHTGQVGTWPCHPAYQECLPVGPDIDCADVGHAVILPGPDDPYRLDGNSTARTDGVGCETYGPWTDGVVYPYYGD